MLLTFPIMKVCNIITSFFSGDREIENLPDFTGSEMGQPDIFYAQENSTTGALNILQVEKYYRSHIKIQSQLDHWSLGCILLLCFEAMMFGMIYLIVRNN